MKYLESRVSLRELRYTKKMPEQFLRDRNDLYIYLFQQNDEARLEIVRYYEIKEVHCNPDFDW